MNEITRNTRIVMTGMGMVTPLGIGKEQFSERLFRGDCGIREIAAFDTSRLASHLGAEVRIHPDVFDLLAIDELPVLGGLGKDRVVLLEFPDGQIPPGAETACRLFADRGIRWLIAHPERNKDVMRDPLRLKPFLDAGCLTQVTAASVVGRFGPQAAACAHYLLANNMVSVVATDSHNLQFRPPMLREARDALAQHYGSGVAYRLTEELPGEIVAGRAA